MCKSKEKREAFSKVRGKRRGMISEGKISFSRSLNELKNRLYDLQERLSKIDFLPQKIIRANLCFLILNLDSISKQQMYLHLYCLQVDDD